MTKVKVKEENTVNIKVVRESHFPNRVQKYVNNDWGTVAYYIPRSSLDEKFPIDELNYNAIYFLIGTNRKEEFWYVGQGKTRNEGSSVLKRLREHDKSTTEKYRDIWNDIIVVTNKDNAWGPTELNMLENALYHEIPKELSLNGNESNAGGGDLKLYTDKIIQILSYVTVIGYRTFEQVAEKKVIQVQEDANNSKVVEDIQKGMSNIPEIITPISTVRKMVDMLPEHLFNPDTKFLDPACKGGEYLREIYDRLMQTESLMAKYPDDITRSNHILTEQLYGIALSNLSYDRTKTKLHGLAYNIRKPESYISFIKDFYGVEGTKDEKGELVKNYFNAQFGGVGMKFDVVIGNPPYNEETGGGAENQKSSIPLHTLFVNLAMHLSPDYLSYIMPCRWYIENDKYNKMTREHLLNKGLLELHDYSDSGDVFQGVFIMGGVCSFLYCNDRNDGNLETNVYNHMGDKEYESKVVFSYGDKFYRYEEMRNIIKKIKAYGEMNFSSKVLSTGPFGFKRADRGSIVATDYYNIPMVSANKEITYVAFDEISKNAHLLDKYKVCVGYTQANAGNYFILKPNAICTLTYTVVYTCDTEEEAANCCKYLETKLARALVDVTKIKLGTTADNYMLVPLQDFSVAWDDMALYKKYNLTDAEIEFISKMVEPKKYSNAKTKKQLTKEDVQANYINSLIKDF